jgi:serine/threonine-protein phosphatase 5
VLTRRVAENNFADAAHLYSKAIEKNGLDATLYCNRAYARMKMEEYGYAIDDSSTSTCLMCLCTAT